MGDVIGDLTSRRGKVEGMEQRGNSHGRSGLRCPCRRCSVTLPTCVRAPRAGPRTRCSSTRTSRSRRRSPRDRRPGPRRVDDASDEQASQGALVSGQGEVRAQQAAPQHRHDGSHRPRQDDADRGHHQDARRARHPGKTTFTAFDQIDKAPEEKAAGHHHLHRPRRVRDGQPPLRPRRHARPRRLHQEHDHRRRPGRRRHPGGLRRRRPHAPDP